MVIVRKPGESDKQKDVKVEKCLKCIYRPHSVHSGTNKLFKTNNATHCEHNRRKSNSRIIGNVDSSYKVQDKPNNEKESSKVAVFCCVRCVVGFNESLYSWIPCPP